VFGVRLKPGVTVVFIGIPVHTLVERRVRLAALLMVENGVFTWARSFWEQPLWRWDSMFSAGVRAHYLASQLAAPAMIVNRRGLIVNISFWAAQKHIANVAYGVSKAATDKMTADMAVELTTLRGYCRVLVPGPG
jgi:dehydrogenase/reductase SDR family member 1